VSTPSSAPSPRHPGVSDQATILAEVHGAEDLSVGPYSVIGFDPGPSRSRFHGRTLNIAEIPTVTIGRNVTIGSHCVIEAGVTIGNDCYIDHGSFVGAGATLGQGVMLRYRAQVHRRVSIGSASIVGGFLCNDAVLGDACDFFGACVHNYVGVSRGTREQAPRLGNRVFVGFNAVIVGGVVLDDEAVVRAGVVVKLPNLPAGNLDPIQSPQTLDPHQLGGA
jgi:carbonic anhydrase/acetyltransferase-like protein (isoleucine patch superfamily)